MLRLAITSILGKWIRKAIRLAWRPERKYFGLENMDQKLERYMRYRNGFYVELGANDGVTQSNTLHFEKFKGWTGVLIEPIYQRYVQCRSSRSYRNSFYYAACVGFGYPKQFVQLAYSDLMSSALGVDSDISNPIKHAKAGTRFMVDGEKVFIFCAPARTLTAILNEATAPKLIDLLSLDVEGAEIEVLRGVDHDKYRFRFMIVECRSFDRLRRYLGGHDYAFVEALSEHDYLFCDRRSSSPAHLFSAASE